MTHTPGISPVADPRRAPDIVIAGTSPVAEPRRRHGIVAAALARAEAWLLEPVADAAEPVGPMRAGPRPVVVVAGMAERSGATTVARALATELARRDPAGAAAVLGSETGAGLPLATAAAGRLARVIAERMDAHARPTGRLCLAGPVEPARIERELRGLAAIVVDTDARSAGPACSIADLVVLVATPATEPPLAAVVAGSLGRVGPEPLVVLNRAARDPADQTPRWDGRTDLVLPESRATARLACSGRAAGGAFAAAIATLADRCEPE